MLLNGVRAAVTGGQRGGGNRGFASAEATREGGAGSGGAVPRERTMVVSLRESVQQVSDPRNLDASVEEVFRMML